MASLCVAHRFASVSAIVFLSFLSGLAFGQDNSDYNPCQSYGVDSQDGGSYFQNASSMDPFTFTSIFEGCQNDICNNILVDPTGDEYLCSDTNLTPDDVNQMSTCPIDKDQMYSGDWSVLLVSNNGDAEPIAYERDFYLTVATPSTVTYTPTVTLSATITPLSNVTTTQTSTTIDTVTFTTVVPAVTKQRTTTSTPHKVTVTSTITMGTVTKIRWTAVPTLSTKTILQTCSIPRRQSTADPTCTITPTIISAAALSTGASATAPPARRRDNARRVPSNREARIAERKIRLAEGRKDKRGLDVATTTVTDQNTLDFPTFTSYSTAPPSTIYVTTQATVTSTTTSTTTSYSGTTNLSKVTITAPTPTKTQTKYTLITTVSTVTKHPIITVKVYMAPPASTSVCQAKGGKMV